MSNPTLNVEILEIQSSSNSPIKNVQDCQEAVASCSKEQTNSENSSENEGTVEEKIRKRKRKRKSFADLHPLQPLCGCKRKCIYNVSHEKREIIYKQYCAITKNFKKNFCFNESNHFRSKDQGSEEVRRKSKAIQRIYSLNVNGKDIVVCSKSFLGTLGYKKYNVISTLFNKQTPTKSRLSASDFPDMWGSRAPIHKMSE